jgi:hypothetical protein
LVFGRRIGGIDAHIEQLQASRAGIAQNAVALGQGKTIQPAQAGGGGEKPADQAENADKTGKEAGFGSHADNRAESKKCA